MVVEPAAPCRASLAAGAPVLRSYAIGEVLDVNKGVLRDGHTWYSSAASDITVAHPGCWTTGDVTISFDRHHPELALDTLARRALRDTSHFRFENLVAVENLFTEPYGYVLQQSGLLQYRRLSIVARAAGLLDPSKATPLETAWVLAHQEFVAQDPFATDLYPLRKPYWELYDRNKSAPWADEVAWTAAQLRPPTDECYSDCVLSIGIVDGPMQYWSRLPHGKSTGAALDVAIAAAKYAASLACYDKADRPVSKSDSPVPPELLKEIRGSLADVTMDSKRELLAALAEAEAKCRPDARR